MSKIDIFLLVVILIGAFQGYRDGFLMGLISLLGIVLGVFLGFKLMGVGMDFLEKEFNADQTTLPYISFFLIFVIVVVLVTLLGKAIRNSIDKTFLGRVDQSMGVVLGAFKTMFMASVILWIADSLKYAPKAEWTEGSWLYPFTAKLAPDLAGWMAQFLPFFREIFPQF
ncbi:MAG TPA: CvpA family protein [Cyclobacteriaceae bacterium]